MKYLLNLFKMKIAIKPEFFIKLFLLLFIVSSCSAQKSSRVDSPRNLPETFEIPTKFIETPLLLINKITGYPNKLYYYGSSGMDVDYSVMLRFELENNELLKIVQHQYQNEVSDTDIIKTSVENNHFDPIVAYVPIREKNKNGIIIDLDILEKNIPLFSPVDKHAIEKYGLQLLPSKPIHINKLLLDGNSIQVSRTLNYVGEKKPEKHYSDNVSVEQLLTFRILPKDPMPKRRWDPRVGNFYLSNTKYSSEDYYIEEEKFLEKWRLEPVDTAAYFNGSIVPPKKPIVFYFDDNVPEKWKKYFKQGILDWLPVFENIGFKNAIEVRDKPDTASWDDSNPNYNMIRWVSSEIADAQGNYVSDPRTGEILSATLTWYQNYFSTINERYFVKLAAVDKSARVPILPDYIFGENIRETMAHEMGHALGLAHNMIASSSYPTDSLRSKKFVEAHSLTPSIMDYASYNYIAQPADMPLPLSRTIGPYDQWAIEHAYKYVTPPKDGTLETAFLKEEIGERLKDQNLHFMEQEYPETIDPTNNTGDLGDDPIRSGAYGIENLKRIVPHIVEWSLTKSGDPSIALNRYDLLIKQLDGLFKNVTLLVGGRKSRSDNSPYMVKTVEVQRDAEVMEFLSNHLFTEMQWLQNEELEKFSTEDLYANAVEKLQSNTLKRLLNDNKLERLIKRDVKHGTSECSLLLRELTDIILKNSTIQEIPLEVRDTYIKRIKELASSDGVDPILKRLAQKELEHINELLKEKIKSENSPIKEFYTSLME